MTEDEARKLLERHRFDIRSNKYEQRETGQIRINYFTFISGKKTPAMTLQELVYHVGLKDRPVEIIDRPDVLAKAFEKLPSNKKTLVSDKHSRVLKYGDLVYVLLQDNSDEPIDAYIVRGVDHFSKIDVDRLPWL